MDGTDFRFLFVNYNRTLGQHCQSDLSQIFNEMSFHAILFSTTWAKIMRILLIQR